MRIVGLISGGKDSMFNMLQCIAAGHEIVAVANIEPIGSKDEMDSYMYQTIGHQTLSLVSAALSLPIYRQKTKGIAVCKEKVYVETPEDEVEDLFALLSKVKDEIHIDGVSVGAIASDYQRTRVENVCMRLNLKCFAYLWKRDQEELLKEMIEAEMNAIVVKVAALGLKPDVHLGASIEDLQPLLLELHKKFGINICGEGGEYETLTIDCPLYHRRIEIIKSEKKIHSDDAFAPVGYLIIKNAVLETKVWENEKSSSSIPGTLDYIRHLVKQPFYYIEDCLGGVADEELMKTYAISSSINTPDVLPFPFGYPMGTAESTEDSRTVLKENWKNKSCPSGYGHCDPHSSHMVTFSPSSTLNVDTSVVQLNLSSGWCCIGNITAPSIKAGLSFVRKHLEQYGYEMRDVVSMTLYVRDMGEWSKINKTYSQAVPAHCPPTRACVGVPAPKNVAVIITVVAHRLVSRTQKVVHHTLHTVDRDFVHVQSISHWAPANIGPYSQCIRVGEIVYVSGQIPLIPGIMELLNGPIVHQCRLTLRHIYRIITAVNETYTMSNVMHGICFVTSEDAATEVSGLWNYITKNEHAAIGIVVVLSLPKNAQLEWQVLACGYDRPQVTAEVKTISDGFVMKYKRCLYPEHYTSSLVCNVSFMKYGKKDKNLKTFTPENVICIMRECLQILRGDIVGSGTPLCMFNVYFKATAMGVAPVINETLKTSLDVKVVISCIPVVACEEPDVFLTVSGVCH